MENKDLKKPNGNSVNNDNGANSSTNANKNAGANGNINGNANAITRLQDAFDLHHDQAHPDKIDAAIRANVRVSGTNMWVLMFAIAVASVGLNVNSTAVIIGAMLISPLMGPIVGIGYGAAVSDVRLIRQSLRNIAISIAVSLLTATLYFSISPLQEAQSELLARTQPNLWDVLIAFFGGSAGMIAITRKEGSNVIPGVAIATALMPPLCTAGYGLAHGNWHYFFGAFYLFSINCVFIAFSSLLFAKLLKLPRRGLMSPSKQRAYRNVIIAVVLAVMTPSAYLATRLVQQELFNTTVSNVVKQVQQEEGFFVLRSSNDYKHKQVALIVNGAGNAEKITTAVSEGLKQAGVESPDVRVVYAGGNNVQLDALKQELAKNQAHSSKLEAQLKQQYSDANQSKNEPIQRVLEEVRVQYPEATYIAVTQGSQWQNHAVLGEDADDDLKDVLILSMQLPEALSEKEEKRLQAWLGQRFEGEQVMLLITTP